MGESDADDRFFCAADIAGRFTGRKSLCDGAFVRFRKESTPATEELSVVVAKNQFRISQRAQWRNPRRLTSGAESLQSPIVRVQQSTGQDRATRFAGQAMLVHRRYSREQRRRCAADRGALSLGSDCRRTVF